MASAVFWLPRLAFVAFNALLGVLSVKATTNFCGSMFEAQSDHILVGHVMRTVVVSDGFECQIKCLANRSCKSFNIHFRADHTKPICELNNKTRKMKPNDFKMKKGSTYYGSVKVSCAGVSHDEYKWTNSGYCHPDYTGRQCQTPKLGLFSHHPAHSCKEIMESGNSRGNLKYWIDPENTGKPLEVHCDMTTDGGGWLLISSIVLLNSTPPTVLPIKTSYRGIGSDQMLLTKTAINQLRAHVSFTQLRFHCNKQQRRTFHVTTVANSSGEAVVKYFSGQTDVQPGSCGSFIRMENDNSKLAKVCKKWGWESGAYEIGKWGHQAIEDRLYFYPAFSRAAYHWHLDTGGRIYCDDLDSAITAGDFWKVFVR